MPFTKAIFVVFLSFLASVSLADVKNRGSAPFTNADSKSAIQKSRPNTSNVFVVWEGCEEGSRIHLTSRCLPQLHMVAAASVLTLTRFPIFIAMGHSAESQLGVAKAMAKRFGWQRLELWTDEPLAPHILGKFVVRHMDFDRRGRRSEIDVIAVHCSTNTCFEIFKKTLSKWRGSNVWIFTEDMTRKYLARLIPQGVNDLGKAAYQQHDRPINLLPIILLREKILATAAYLHDSLLLLSHLTRANASVFARRTIRNLAQRRDGHLRGRAHDQYDMFRLSDSSRKAGVNSEGNIQSFARKRSRRDVQRCPPAVRINGTYHFRIVTVQEPRFLFYNPNATQKFTGFIMDMMEHLSKNLGFTYELRLSPDGTYGDFASTTRRGVPDPGGLLGEIVDCRADLGIAAIGITANRQKHVDFTNPWMDYGLVLLKWKSSPISPSFFAFLDPFTPRLWILSIVSIVVFSISYALLQMITPKRLQENDDDSAITMRSLPKRLLDSIWFFFATAMQQGLDRANFFAAKILGISSFSSSSQRIREFDRFSHFPTFSRRNLDGRRTSGAGFDSLWHSQRLGGRDFLREFSNSHVQNDGNFHEKRTRCHGESHGRRRASSWRWSR